VLQDQVSGTTARLQAVSVVSAQVVWASGTQGTFVRTRDGGATWHAGVVPGADSLEFRDVEALSADTAWLLAAGPGDRSRIYRTIDGGSTWTLQFRNADPRAFFDCLSFWDSRRGIVVSDAVDGAFVVRRTGDGGDHWEPVPVSALPPARPGEGLFAASGTCLTARDDTLAWFGTGAGLAARVARTTDGGHTWSVAETPIAHGSATAGIMSLVFLDARNGIALGGDLTSADGTADRMGITEDGGISWRGAAGPTFRGPVYGAAAGPGRRVVAVGPNGASWSADGGRTWRPLDDRNYWSVGIAGDGTAWMVGPEGRITQVVGLGRED
jgi:photosystem II stability/assembly factor-like uncharacterized protein